jgi:hypothetical protein
MPRFVSKRAEQLTLKNAMNISGKHQETKPSNNKSIPGSRFSARQSILDSCS